MIGQPDSKYQGLKLSKENSALSYRTLGIQAPRHIKLHSEKQIERREKKRNQILEYYQ